MVIPTLCRGVSSRYSNPNPNSIDAEALMPGCDSLYKIIESISIYLVAKLGCVPSCLMLLTLQISGLQLEALNKSLSMGAGL